MLEAADSAGGVSRRLRRQIVAAAVIALSLVSLHALAGPLRDRIAAWWKVRALPAGVELERNVPYGRDPQQTFDVYRPAHAQRAPVILMVHGGAWRLGDKTARGVVLNKVTRWVPRGFVFISTNYRLLPTDPVEQARDVARALAVAQDRAAGWGADREKFILMGHSAGAHLVALLATAPALSAGVVTTPWLGTVSLDSGALNVVEIMRGRHLPLYDAAFGSDPAYWHEASPFFALNTATRPILAVCSARRSDSCPQAREFAARAQPMRVSVTVLAEDLSHGEINARLGGAGSYTAAVESFMAGLDGGVARRLANQGQARRGGGSE